MMLQNRFLRLLSAAGFARALDLSHNGNYGSPFPETTYPGYETDNPVVISGSKDFQKSPPSYPSPWGEGLGNWAEAYDRAIEFVSQLTLEEKVNLTTGTGWEMDRCVGQTGSIPRLGFRALCLQDSPVGVRMADFSSVFPAGVNVAATWDRNAAYIRGRAMGKEHAGKGTDIQLAPVAGPLGRSPQGGRNWEGFSPDPVLTGVMFAESIKGIQSAGVMTSAKHFIANEQEHFRQVPESNSFGFNISEPLSSNLDDQTMHELYMWPFADGVKAGVTSVMCSYNQVNNSQACQNSYALNHLLKKELGFQGFVMSDWTATKSGVASILAGLDMTMPGDVSNDVGTSYFGANLTVAVLNGTVPAWRLDDMVTRIMAGFFYVGRDIARDPINFSSWTTDTYGYEHSYVGKGWTKINDHIDVRGDHASLIRFIGARSIVLLKNDDKTLPLTGKEPLTAVFGNDAGPNMQGPNGCSDRGCDNGTLGMAWGSGTANFPYLVAPDTAIQNEIIAAGGAYESVLNNWALDAMSALARRASVSLVFANSDSGEGYIQVDSNFGDRNNLTFWQGADAAVRAVAAECNRTILVVHSTGPVLLEEYQNHPNITAILWAGIPGQESGNSIADILYGRVSPGAKLPFTVGKNRKDYGTDILYTPNHAVPQASFKEGVFIDYRAFDRHHKTPTYEFGFGLSYTTFQFSDLRASRIPDAPPYEPVAQYTPAAPVRGFPGNPDPNAHVFPAGFPKVPLYIYPWLNVSDLATASRDANYGAPGSLPDGARNGSIQAVPRAGGAPGGNPRLYDVLYRVSATVANTGAREGDEVAQLYVGRGGPYDPVRELRGFERIHLQVGERKEVVFELTRRDVSYWDTGKQDWVIRDAEKHIWVGASSRDLRLEAVLPQ